MRKRGQLNIYVILGILIVAIAVLVVYYQEKLTVTTWDLEKLTAARIPEEATEVHDYVADCLREVGTEGLTRLGAQGGYISLPADTYGGRSPINEFSNTLEIIPELETAYWFYQTPNGIQKTVIPTKKDMETELSQYVADNLALCTQNFSLLELYNVTAGQANVETEILDNRVLFTVNYPLQINTPDFSHELSRFYFDVDSMFGTLYETANDILEAENKDNFFEEKTIDILAVYEDIPYAGTDTECQPKFWLKQEVETALKNALFANIPFIKLKGTDFKEREKYFVEDADLKSSNVNVQMLYSQSWPLEMSVEPSDGDVLVAEPLFTNKMEELALISSMVCIRDYNFIYDIKYPVLVVLSDEQGTVFQFATQVIIDNNQPRENVYGTLNFESNEGKICSNKLATQTVYALAPDNEGNLNPVRGAEVNIKCVSTECEIGKTSGRDASLTADFPQCFNALVTADKQGYHRGRETVSTIEEGTISVTLEPYYELDVQVKMVDNGIVRLPRQNEDYVITLAEDDKSFVEIIMPETRKVNIIAGKYDVSSQAFAESESGITIEGKRVETCVTMPQKSILGIFGLTEEKCFSANIPDITLARVMKGGADYSWNVPRDVVASAEKLTIYIPVVSTPKTMEDMEAAQDMVETPINLVSPLLE